MYSDEYYMAQAISLARKGWYSTQPNPRVGCLLVKDEKIISQGWHEYAGQGHAEVNALRGVNAQGATAYVSLEPCSHFGKTPPCSNALIDAGVKRVVVGMVDPNPLVSGNGVKRLREQGIEVKTAVLEQEARKLNPGFIQRMESQRPLLRGKMAMSLDGRTAMANGESKWITSPEAREDVQRLRAQSSAILTGIGTVLADNPSMNVRSSSFIQGHTPMKTQPERVILDSQLRMSPESKMLALDGRTIICTALASQHALREKALKLEAVGACIEYLDAEESSDSKQTQLSPEQVIEVLAKRHYNEVLLEAGATLTGSMLQAGLVDELIIYMAPHLMGSEARGLFNLPGLCHMSDRIDLTIEDIRSVGKDFRITAAIVK